jgi:hypothetical protein
MKMPIVANVLISAKSPDGEVFVIGLEIGAPYPRETGEWACPVALRGLYDRLPDVAGLDSLQALCHAIGLAQSLLRDFREKGGILLLDGEN